MKDVLSVISGLFRRKISYLATIFLFYLAFLYLIINSHYESKSQLVLIGMVTGLLPVFVMSALRADENKDKISK